MWGFFPLTSNYKNVVIAILSIFKAKMLENFNDARYSLCSA